MDIYHYVVANSAVVTYLFSNRIQRHTRFTSLVEMKQEMPREAAVAAVNMRCHSRELSAEAGDESDYTVNISVYPLIFMASFPHFNAACSVGIRKSTE